MNKNKISFFPPFKQHRTEWICFGLLVVLALVALCHHELWSDEAQSWQIARTAPWYELLFRIPHYEGHPPFWHALLALPAKAGLAWTWTLRTLGMLTMLCSGFLLIFKAPFPRWVRCVLPFTYFLFYQYGVIVRPYNLMVLILLLLALCFPTKDTRPGRFVLLLAALCACHLFGIAMAGGITIAWLWEIKGAQPLGEWLRKLKSDKRFHWMLGLLAWAILLLLMIVPTSHSAAYRPYLSPVWRNVIYLLFGLPADAFLTNIYNTFFIREAAFTNMDLLRCVFMGSVVWAVWLAVLPKAKWKYLLWPYGLLLCVMICYCSRHHIGLFALLAIWCAWISMQEPGFTWPHCLPTIRKGLLFLLGLSALVGVGWTAHQFYADVTLNLFSGPQTIAFLQENDLLDKRIFSYWGVKVRDGVVLVHNVHAQSWSALLNLYTTHNIVANFHEGGPKQYSGSEDLDGDDISTFEKWRAGGEPDILLGSVDLQAIWPQREKLASQYLPVWEIQVYDLWKFDPPRPVALPIYVRKDLVADRHLQVVETHDWGRF